MSKEISTNLASAPLRSKEKEIENCWTAWRMFASTVPEIAVPCPDDLNLTNTTVEDYLKRIERHAALYQEKLKIDQDTAWMSVAVMSCKSAADGDKVG